MLKQINPDEPIITPEAALAILDQIDDIRRHASEKHNDADFCCRIAAAIVAKAGGFYTRAAGCDALRNDPTSSMAKDDA